MTELQSIFWHHFNDVALEKLPGKSICDHYPNPIKTYLRDEPMNVLEIGPCHSVFITDLIDGKHQFVVYDEDEFNNRSVLRSIEQINPDYLQKISSYRGKFPETEIDYSKFNLLIFSNVFHFVPHSELIRTAALVTQQVKPKSLIYFRTHFKEDGKVPTLHSNDLSEDDIYLLFPKESYKYHFCKAEIGAEPEIDKTLVEFALKRTAIEINRDVSEFLKANKNSFNDIMDWFVLVEKK